MNSLDKYLQERAEYFYPEDKIINEDNAVEEPLIDSDIDVIDGIYGDEIIVEIIPNNSDPILDSSEFMYTNSEMQAIYSQGKGFELTSNQDLYEVVKLVKDFCDRHQYQRDMTWRVDIANRKAIFTFMLGDQKSKDENEFFLQGVNQYIMSDLYRRFGNLYNVNSEYTRDGEGGILMKMVVEKKPGEKRKLLKKVDTIEPNQELGSSIFTT